MRRAPPQGGPAMAPEVTEAASQSPETTETESVEAAPAASLVDFSKLPPADAIVRISPRGDEPARADVVLRESEDDPWAEIEITNINVGFYLISDNTMQPGRVLGEIDGDAYLPYYFKMTDFFSG